MLGLRSIIVAVALLAVAGAAEQQEKPPAPATPEQVEAEKMIKDVFKAEYAKRTSGERQALAKQLLTQGIESKDDLKFQFVLLREARDIAAQAGDASTALTAVDELAKRFSIDAAVMRTTVLAQSAKAAKTPEDFKSLVAHSFKLIETALAADDYDGAEKIAGPALQFAKRAQDVPLVNRVTSKSKEIADLRTRHEKLKKARETLAIDPSDGAANLLVGQFMCLTKGDWEKGLPLLAKSSDPVLGPLAQKDLAGPTDPAGQAALGDGWWDLSEKDATAAKDRLKERAGLWYAKAIEKLSGFNKTKVEKRLSECRISGVQKGTWMDITDSKLFNLPGKPGDPVEVLCKPGQTVTATMQFPKGDYDGFSARITLDPAKNCTAFLIYDGPNSLAALLDAERGFFASAKGTGNGWNLDYTDWWTKDAETVITVLLAGGEYVLYVNGREKTRLKTTKTRLEHFALEGRNAPIKFDRIKLRRAE